MVKNGMGSHQSSKMIKDEWITPKYIIEELPYFDLDPCSPVKMPWDTADYYYTKNDDGLKCNWFGKVWLNPPYGKDTGLWLRKLSKYNNGIALIFARTETEMFFKEVWNKASSLLFLKGRVTFCYVNGEKGRFNGGAPSVLISYGDRCAHDLAKCKLKGKYIKLP